MRQVQANAMKVVDAVREAGRTARTAEEQARVNKAAALLVSAAECIAAHFDCTAQEKLDETLKALGR